MKKVTGAALVGALCLVIGCGREDSKNGSSKPTPPGEKEWGEDEMATDPEGYLKWADKKLASQIKQREELLAGLSAKKKDIAARREKFSGDYEAIENLERRLGTATRRASDEDRWPVTVAGKTFTKEEAEALLAQTKQFLADRKALASTYGDAVAKLADGEKSLRDEIARITTLRDKVSVDLERVKVDRANPELDKLRKTEAEIEHYSKVLTPFADVNVQNLPKPTQPTAELQSMLK